jgi:hypothetical protein
MIPDGVLVENATFDHGLCPADGLFSRLKEKGELTL